MKVSNKKDPTKIGNVIAEDYVWAVGIGLIKKIKILDSVFGTTRWEPAKDWEVIEGEGDHLITFKVGDDELTMQDDENREEFITKMIERVLVQRQKGDFIISAENLRSHIEKYPASVDDAYETLADYVKEKCRQIVTAAILHRRARIMVEGGDTT